MTLIGGLVFHTLSNRTISSFKADTLLKFFRQTNCSKNGMPRLCCSSTDGCQKGSQSNDSEDFTAKWLERHYFPDDSTAQGYKSLFPDPVKLVTELHKPLMESNKEYAPSVHFISKFNGRLWKVKLHLKFPNCFSISGIHSDPDKAAENAYLEACKLYQYLGLIYIQDKCLKLFTPEVLQGLLEKICQQTIAPKKSKNFSICTTRITDEGCHSWETSINMTWPYHFCVRAKAVSYYSSRYEAALQAAINMKLHKIENIKGLDVIKRFIPLVDNYEPEFVIHVDASCQGYGAYLQMKNGNKVNWIYEEWPENFKCKYICLPGRRAMLDSTFSEIYALVAVCYTWKHKFINNRVLCYSDSLTAVNLINRALYLSAEKKQKERYRNFIDLLLDTIYKYKIDFLACHLSRHSNTIADLLAHKEIEEFKKEMPAASEKPKKSKKLYFCCPKEIF